MKSKTMLKKSLACLALAGAWSALSTPLVSEDMQLAGLLISSARAATAQEITQTLFDPETEDAQFQTALGQAKAAQVSDQVVFEARLLRLIRGGDNTALIKLAGEGETEKYLGAPDLKTSRFFKTPQTGAAMLHGLRALQAGEKNDAATFEREIKDAFWNAPEMADLFGEWAQEFRNAQEQEKLTLPLDLELKTSDGKTTTLKQVLGGNKALLLDFWASWCGPCMNLMDELKAKGAKLKPQGVIVAGMNTENDAAKASKVKRDKAIDLPWLLEPGDEPYSSALKIDSIPRMILVSPEGKVLYNGHPSDPKLKNALAKLNVTL